MANQKIHEYPLERFVYGDDDYYDIDYWDGVAYQTAKILGSTIKAAMLSGIAISLTAPSAFIVGGSPVDGTGTLTLTAAGLANQYIRGDGTLATFPTSGGGGNNVNFFLNGGTAASVATYYQMSKTAVIGTGVDFSLAGNGLISQWLTDVSDPNVTEIPAGNWNFEMFFSASSAGGTPKFYIEILKYDGATFTTIADNSLVPESITSGTAIDLYLTSVPVPLTAMLTTDRIALRVYIVDSVIGRTITQHTQDSHLCQVITTFSSGLSSINGLTEQTQYLAVGTAGTDFAINSVTDTHTFNLPTASATNRGALSSANWSTFNGKQNQITLTTTGSGAATFIADTLNIPTPSGGTPAGITGQIQFNNGGVFGADSGLFWDNTNKRLGLGATPSTTVRLDVRAQGALSTDIVFRVRNSADTRDIVNIRGNKTIELLADTPATNGGISITSSAYNEPIINMYDNFGSNKIKIDASNLIMGISGSGNIKIGILTATGNSYLGLVTPSTNNRFLKLVDAFNNEYLSLGGNAYDGAGGISLTLKTTTTNNSNFVTFSRSNNTNPFVITDQAYTGIGTNAPAARLDIRAQGALSTDIAFRVRNSADTVNLVDSSGSGSFFLRANTGDMHFMFDAFNSRIHLKRTGVYTITTDNAVTALDINCNNGNLSLKGGSSMLNIVTAGNFHFEEPSGTIATSGAGAIVMKNRTAPSTNVQDRFYLYSADITAGNAAPHFRTENGSIVKLYQETTAIAAATLVSNLGTPITDTDTFDGYTLKQIVKALRNQGLLT